MFLWKFLSRLSRSKTLQVSFWDKTEGFRGSKPERPTLDELGAIVPLTQDVFEEVDRFPGFWDRCSRLGSRFFFLGNEDWCDKPLCNSWHKRLHGRGL